MSRRTVFLTLFIALLFVASVPRSAVAADASLNGKVLDQLGAPIDMAKVTLLRNGQRVNDTTSDSRGEFTFAGLAEGRRKLHERHGIAIQIVNDARCLAHLRPFICGAPCVRSALARCDANDVL